METYQKMNPNNSCIYIDYRKEKNKVKFHYVGKKHPLSIALFTIIRLMFVNGLIIIPTMIWIIMVSPIIYNNGFNDTNIPFIYQFGIFLTFFDILIAFTISSSLLLIKTKLIKYMPKLNSIGSTRYKATFNKKNTNKIIEIPLFSNTVLDYRATKDFSYYLDRVEITEHPFNILLRKKKRRNEYLWKALFYYSKIPKEGKLEVVFK